MQVKIVKVLAQINKKENILKKINKKYLGNIVYLKSKKEYNYYTLSFNTAKNIINYLDKYHLLSNKHINYLK